ncbi:hypothetical protein MAMMFC1_02608 [Methylomusa anaerophila]|uniref:Uncharacterized protein n=1 Tax=Methylomusa anaerophila TaxID=1930071 RepID=A0A348ALH5_9FIRM|nr:hypothetical protein MAMMFC1_02608 [Methylomusa anaerophila]
MINNLHSIPEEQKTTDSDPEKPKYSTEVTIIIRDGQVIKFDQKIRLPSVECTNGDGI